MKNIFKVLGIIALVAVIGFSVIACDDGSNDDKGNPDNGENGSGGTLTIINIPSEYNGNYALYSSSVQPLLMGAQSVDFSDGTVTATGVQVVNGSVTLPMWVLENNGFTRFSGNHTVSNNTSRVFIVSTADAISGNFIDVSVGTARFQSVTFTNGSATIDCNNLNGNGNNGNVVDGKFTITGIPSEHNGKYAFVQTMVGTDTVYGFQSYSNLTYNFVLIANNSVSVPMWKIDGDTLTATAYTGSGTGHVSLGIFNTSNLSGDEPIASRVFQSVTFSNGGASRTWAQGQ